VGGGGEGEVLFMPSGFEELILPTITSFLKGRKTIMRNSTTYIMSEEIEWEEWEEYR